MAQGEQADGSNDQDDWDLPSEAPPFSGTTRRPIGNTVKRSIFAAYAVLGSTLRFLTPPTGNTHFEMAHSECP